MTGSATTAVVADAGEGHLRGIDTVRFLCAFWVAISHVGLDVLLLGSFAIDESSSWGRLAHGISNNIFPGPPAVIIFFVVSGFCIHLPQARGRALQLLPFYTRRYLRICPPLVAAALLCWLVADRPFMLKGIVWSLACEAFYYFLYPALLVIARGTARGWWPILGTAFLTAFFLRFQLGRDWGNYLDYHWSLTWLLGLPCWLLGCVLAQHFSHREPVPSLTMLWAARGLVWFLAFAASVLRFHTAVDYKWTLNFFAIAGAAWLLIEIRYATARGAGKWLEQAGAWSYSLYLLHIPGAWLAHQLVPAAASRWLIFSQLFAVMVMLVVAWLFYRLAEKPSHELARRCGNLASGYLKAVTVR